MLRYDVNTVFLTVQRSTRRKESKTRRVCYAIIGARRLDYNEDGKVFVLDPYLEPSAMLNKYKDKDATRLRIPSGIL